MKQIILKPEPTIKEENTIGISDSISYIVELIIQFSKYVTNKRGLSKNGVNALLLFILTFGLLFTNTQMPITLMDKLKLYSVPLLFFLYFFVDLAKNIDQINKFFRRLGQRTEFSYQNIMDGNIYYEDLGFNLSELNFNYKQITNIIIKLIESEQFTPNIQKKLLLNNAIYRLDTLPFIRESFINPIFSIKTTMKKDEPDRGEGTFNDPIFGTHISPLIGNSYLYPTLFNSNTEQYKLDRGEKENNTTHQININWTPSAVCIFVSKMRKNLPNEYLDKLIDKYGKYPSVLIAIGHFCQYKKGDATFFKIGNEFKYTRKLTKISKVLMFSTIALLIFFGLSTSPTASLNEKQYFIGAMVLFFGSFIFSIYIEKNDLAWSLKSHLKNYDVTKDDFVINEINSDLDESF